MTEKIDYMSWSEDSAEFLPKLRRVFQDVNIRIASIEDTGRKLADIERRYGVVALERISDAITPAINEARALLAKVERDLVDLDEAYRRDGQQRVDDIINPLIEQARQALEKTKTDLAAIDLTYRQEGQRRVDEIINPLLTQTKKTLVDAEAALAAINAVVSSMQPLSEKGQPEGYAGLDAAGKVPTAQLPPLTNSTTVGAALAAPTPAATLNDGDKIGGILSGSAKLTTWSWATIKAAIKAFTDPLYATAIQGRKADKAVRYDAQTLTAQEQDQARANINAGILSGFRNKLINGDFVVNQRKHTTPVPVNGYRFVVDRWGFDNNSNKPCDVVIWPRDYSNGWEKTNYSPVMEIIPTSKPAAGVFKISQPIEGVNTLAGKTATLTFYVAKTTIILPESVCLLQYFGNGGTASAPVYTFGTHTHSDDPVRNLRRWDFVFNIPEIRGKVVDGGNHCLRPFIFFDASSEKTMLTRVSLVEGDATTEADPFSPRHIQQELDLCQRYYQVIGRIEMFMQGGAIMPSIYRLGRVILPTKMRTDPTVIIGAAPEYNSKPNIFAGGGGEGASFDGFVREAHNWGWLENVAFDAEL